MMERSAALPFSRPVSVRAIPDSGLTMTIDATPEECQALQELAGVVAISRLQARFDLVPKGPAIRVQGVVSANVTQLCSVTLDPFEATLDEPIELVFMPQANVDAWIASHRTRPDHDLACTDDPPDVIVDGKIDLGAAAAEFLVLGLPPYPRKPGVDFLPEPEDDEPSPLAAALAQWKKDE